MKLEHQINDEVINFIENERPNINRTRKFELMALLKGFYIQISNTVNKKDPIKILELKREEFDKRRRQAITDHKKFQAQIEETKIDKIDFCLKIIKES